MRTFLFPQRVGTYATQQTEVVGRVSPLKGAKAKITIAKIAKQACMRRKNGKYFEHGQRPFLAPNRPIDSSFFFLSYVMCVGGSYLSVFRHATVWKMKRRPNKNWESKIKLTQKNHNKKNTLFRTYFFSLKEKHAFHSIADSVHE